MPIVTISRGSLSGGELLAEHLGARLHYKVLSREVIIEAAKKYGISEGELAASLDQPAGFWERLQHKKERYLLAVQATLAEMLLPDGNGVYHGHAGQFLLKGLPGVLKLRILAPLEYRVRSAMIELDLTRDQALAHIATVDDRRVKWVQQLYGRDWHDPSLYDLVINLDQMSVETAAELAVDLLGRPEYRRSAENIQKFQDFALAARVRAELAFHSSLPEHDVTVFVMKGVVHLSGGPTFESNRKKIVRFVKSLEGVERVAPDDEQDESEPASHIGTLRDAKVSKARDIMLPLERYPHIHQWVSIREAILAVSASAVRLEDDHLIYPRYIIVLDDKDRFTGVINRRGLLMGLLPQLQDVERIREHFRGLLPESTMSLTIPIDWDSLFSHGAIERSWEPVESIMTPIKGTVEPDAPLSVVLDAALTHEIDVVPVAEGQKALGVVLMIDIFDTVAEFIIERSGKAR